MIKAKIGVIGGDLRLIEAASVLADLGFECAISGADSSASLPEKCTRAVSPESAISKSAAILAPIPLSRDGVSLNLPGVPHPPSITDFVLSLTPAQILFAGCIDEGTASMLTGRGIPFVDLCEIDEYAYPNAYATAEATLGLLILNTGMLLQDSRVAIFGAGRIAKYLIPMLGALGAQICVFARSPADRAYMRTLGCAVSDFLPPDRPFADVLINTVPALPPCDPMQVLRKDGLLLELCGVRREDRSDYRLLRAPSLPGRYCYRSMGRILAKTVLTRIEREDQRKKREKTKE